MIKIKILLLFAFISFGCKESKTKTVIVTNVNNVEVELKKASNKLKDSNDSIFNECFEKIGSTEREETKVAIFKGFSLQAVSKDFRTHFLLKNTKNTTTFDTDIVLDMGELYYWAYDSSSKNYIYLLELDNYYSSTFFILLHKNNYLYSLGNISIDQPNAEEGLKKESFKFCCSDNKLFVETFLDKQMQKTKEFEISSEKIVKEYTEENEETNDITSYEIGSVVYPKVETYLNVRSKPNSRGDIIGKAYPQDALKILEVVGSNWLRISLNGKEGYVSSEFVK